MLVSKSVLAKWDKGQYRVNRIEVTTTLLLQVKQHIDDHALVAVDAPAVE